MKFDIARQPLVPAFLTLFALAVAAMCGAGVLMPDSAVRIDGRSANNTEIMAQTAETAGPGLTAETDQATGTETAAEPRGTQTGGGNGAGRMPLRPTVNTCATDPLDTKSEIPAPATGIHGAISDTSDPTSGDTARTHGSPDTTTSTRFTTADPPVTAPVQQTAPASAGLAVSSPGELLACFQTAFPGWSRMIAGFLILFTGMCLGRLTVRYNLYSVGTCLAIPLYGIVACGLAVGSDFLTAFAAAALLALAVKNFSRSFCNGYAFDPLFRASLYLGLLPLVSTAALPLLLLLPLALLLFRRTVREAVVAAAGLLLPALTLCYMNWGAGGVFSAPIEALGAAFVQGPPLILLATLPLPELILLGFVVVLDLFALFFFLADIYAAGTKPRFILVFCVCALALTILLLAGPAATCGGIALSAVVSALLLPFLFVRISRAAALPLYLLLLCAALAGAVLQ